MEETRYQKGNVVKDKTTGRKFVVGKKTFNEVNARQRLQMLVPDNRRKRLDRQGLVLAGALGAGRQSKSL